MAEPKFSAAAVDSRRAAVFSIVPPYHCGATIATLEDLLAQARRGEVVGLVAVAMGRARKYEFVIAGEAARSLTFALGALGALQAEITEQLL